MKTSKELKKPVSVNRKKNSFAKFYDVEDVNEEMFGFMSIWEYNQKYNTAFSLDDVYGKGYIDSLNEKEKTVYELMSRSIRLDDNLLEDIHAELALQFAISRHDGVYTDFTPLLADDIKLVIFGRETIYGKKDFCEYWEDRKKRSQNDHVEISSAITMCNHFAHAVVCDTPKGYAPQYLYFILDDNQKKITTAVYFSGRDISIDKLNPSYDFVQSIVTGSFVKQENDMPCSECGKLSEDLEWVSVEYIKNGIRHQGIASYCPSCKKTVQFWTSGSQETDEPDTTITDYEERDFTYPEISCHFLFFSNKVLTDNDVKNLDPSYIVEPKCYGLSNEDTYNQPQSLVDVAKSFNTINLQELRETNVALYDQIKACYKKVLDAGNWEAANNLGVLASNYEKQFDEGVKLLESAASHGSRNAMINLFALFWGNEDYDKALEFLQKYLYSEVPSARCLWNAAVLYLLGNDVKGNSLSRNWQKAKELFQAIMDYTITGEYCDVDDEDLAKLKTKTKALLNAMAENNMFGLNGKQFHQYLKSLSINRETPFPDCYNFDVENILSSLHFNGELMLHYAEEVGRGDTSWFYVDDPSEPDSKEANHNLNLATFKADEMAAWQYYLLLNSSSALPTFWHGGYNRRQYAFCISDLMDISDINGQYHFRDKDINVYDKKLLLPSVSIKDNKAYITCCYWNDWKGLVRETSTIDFQTKSLEITKEEILYKYDCMIFF